MSSVLRRVRAAACGLAASGVFAACTHADTPTVRPEAPPSRGASAAGRGATPGPAAEARPCGSPACAPVDPAELAAAKAWTDPVVVRALAHDCGYEPAARDHDGERPGAMSCELEWEQSCVPDPCFETDQQECKPACKKGCDDCAAKCKSGCEQCKTGCPDESCRQACATKCGECRQACLRDKDHCASGTCGAAYEACSKKLAAEWKTSTCARVCPAVSACAQRCYASANAGEDCVRSCKQRLMKGCPDKFFGFCLFGVKPEG